jgi:hypothetical protein
MSGVEQSLNVEKFWRRLADGLLIQRVALHAEEWEDVLNANSPLPDLPGVNAAALASLELPADETSSSGSQLRELGYWLDIPARYAMKGKNPLQPACAKIVRMLDVDSSADHVTLSARQVARASAWWVGFFAIIRHRGFEPTSLTPVKAPVTFSALEQAAELVALGSAFRVLDESFESLAAADRSMYAWLLTEIVKCEPAIPQLLRDLGELRLVDLVSLTFPGRDQFTPFRTGVGPGQVE